MKRFLIVFIAIAMMMSLCCAANAEGDGYVRGFSLSPITWDDSALGKVAVPTGYQLQTEVRCSDESTCLGAPLRVGAQVISPDGMTTMFFYANEVYMDRVKTNSILQHIDGAYDSQTMIFMQRYRNADQYCDARVAMMIGYPLTFDHAEDMSYFDQTSEEFKQEYYNEIVPGLAQYGMKADWLEVTAAQRVYTFDLNGVPFTACITASVRGYQYTLPNGHVCILWNVPGFYLMTCPSSQFREIHDSLFTAFVENTQVSDRFIQLQDQLSDQIRDETIRQMNMVAAASMAYAAAMDSFRSASVASYLQGSSYDASARFSDYIFDRNTYETSDGSEISVSTSYSYVWDAGGSVGFSDSALDVPYGATLLDPIR